MRRIDKPVELIALAPLSEIRDATGREFYRAKSGPIFRDLDHARPAELADIVLPVHVIEKG